MTLFLYMIFIYPVYMFVEFIFSLANMLTNGNTGLSIVVLSLAVNIICLPIYLVAEKWQEKERAIQKKLKPKITDIKAVFSGDERYMILSTFYRQNHYHPLYALRGLFPLLIQIPFFIAAYSFLLHLPLLHNTSFLFLEDLSAQDGLLTIGGISINLLPIVMTAINIAASAVYAHDLEVKDKLQLYISAAIFFVLLYNSPSGLVFYWTLNNLFSLLKNIFYKVPVSKQVWYGIAIAAFAVAAVTTWVLSVPFKATLILIVCTVLVALIPAVKKLCIAQEAKGRFSVLENNKSRFDIFLLSTVSILLLIALVIPTTMMASSPTEFCNVEGIKTPIGILYYTGAQCLGCLLWLIALYTLFNKPQVQKTFAYLSCIILAISLIDAYIFIGNEGTISNFLTFEDEKKLQASYTLFTMNLVAIAIGIAAMTALLFSKFAHAVMLPFLKIIIAACIVLTLISGIIIHKGMQNTSGTATASAEIEHAYTVSKTGKNIFIIMLDRSMNFFLDPIFEHCEAVQKGYTGFTVFENTVSFGEYTNMSVPSLFGGYEYTPENINKRSTELLVDKHNEAMSVLPKLFSEHGWNVSFTDPPWLNYSWEQDLSVFDTYDMTTENIDFSGKYTASFFYDLSLSDTAQRTAQDLPVIYGIKRNMLMFSILRLLPHFAQSVFYANGKYGSVNPGPLLRYTFFNAYSALENLDKEVEFVESGDCINIIVNNATHEPPDSDNVKFIGRDELIPLAKSFCKNQYTEKHFYANYLAHESCAKFFQFLKENDCYDNSRIIIMGDHGRYGIETVAMNFLKNFKNRGIEPTRIMPLLMIKDFNAEGKLKKNHDFMTLADVPILATEGLPSELQKNPFSGIPFKQSQDKRVVKSMYTGDWHADRHLKLTQFKELGTEWMFIKDNVFDSACWSKTGFDEK